MRTTDAKAIEYLKGNPIVAAFIDEVNTKRLKQSLRVFIYN